MADAIREKTNKPLEVVVIQDEGGTVNAINKAVKGSKKGLFRKLHLLKKKKFL